MFSAAQNAALGAQLAARHVRLRRRRGRDIAYVAGWHAIAEANRIFGFDAWSRETVEARCVSEDRCADVNGAATHRCAYVARVRVTVDAGGGRVLVREGSGGGRVLVREGSGAGHGLAAAPGEAHEAALKEAETDAMKRALVTFGSPFGLALYDPARREVAPPETAASALACGLDTAASLDELAHRWAACRAGLRARPAAERSRLEALKNSRKAALLRGVA